MVDLNEETEMQLRSIQKLEGTIEVITGLHIGAGNVEMRIGGTDNPVIKNPVNGQPYIPGSSIKGKMRSLMEWYFNLVDVFSHKPVSFGKPVNYDSIKILEERNDYKRANRARDILMLFGGAPMGSRDEKFLQEIGPSRLSFWDCPLNSNWIESVKQRSISLTEMKMENSIDRITGVALNPRNTERVPAGAHFDFQLTIRNHDDQNDAKIRDLVFKGMKLVELTGLGGSGSRGYGKVKFSKLSLEGENMQAEFDQVSLNQ